MYAAPGVKGTVPLTTFDNLVAVREGSAPDVKGTVPFDNWEGSAFGVKGTVPVTTSKEPSP